MVFSGFLPPKFNEEIATFNEELAKLNEGRPVVEPDDFCVEYSVVWVEGQGFRV